MLSIGIGRISWIFLWTKNILNFSFLIKIPGILLKNHQENPEICFCKAQNNPVTSVDIIPTGPLAVSTIDEKLREKLVIEFDHIRTQAVEPLATFLDFMTYSYMIDNIILLITGDWITIILLPLLLCFPGYPCWFWAWNFQVNPKGRCNRCN